MLLPVVKYTVQVYLNYIRPVPQVDVVFLGDSLTSQWPLWYSFPAISTFNAGVSGNETEQMLIRFSADVIAHHPKKVVILGGGNDIGRGKTLVSAESNLDAIIVAAQWNNIEPILCSDPSTDNPSFNSELIKLNAWMQGEAVDRRIHFVDFYTGFDEVLMTVDGHHPNGVGYTFMKGRLESYLR